MEQKLIDDILDQRTKAMDDFRPGAFETRQAEGHLSARERIAALVEPGSFVEYGVLAETAPEAPGGGPADGIVTGVGLLAEKSVVIVAVDATVHEGTLGRRNVRKIEKMLFLAVEHRWPLVWLLEGEGVRAPELENDREWGGSSRLGVFDGLAELSGWAPTVAVLFGRCFAGNAAIAMFCDTIIATKDTLLGLGPAELPVETHEQMGDIDLVVADDAAAIAAAQKFLTFVSAPEMSGEASPTAPSINAIVPESRKRAYDMRKVIAAVADAGSVLELRPNWAKSMLTSLARLDGRSVGIFANQPLSVDGGAIDPVAADKLSRFVELCNAYDFPLVSFIDNPGYMVGPRAEKAGIARHHARPLAAIHHRTVPLYSIQVRKAYGLGPFAMSGYGSSRLVPDLRLAWPSVESGGMSLEGAAYLVRRKEILAAKTPEEALAIRDDYAKTVRDMRSGLRAGMSFQFDDIIEPIETRGRLIAMLQRTPIERSAVKKHYIDPL